MQILVAATATQTFACFFYETLSWPTTPGFTLLTPASPQAPSGSRYTLPGGAVDSSVRNLASTSGGWHRIGQAGRPGSWCFTVHAICAASPGGCTSVGPPTTTSCGANAEAALVLGGIDGQTPYAADDTCRCSPGAYLRPVDDIKTQGCTLVANCQSGAACPGVNVRCDWASGSNACVCKPGWQVAVGEVGWSVD